MAALVWGERRYETGLSRGVLYPETGPGVVWNGLTSVDETYDNLVMESFYFDGVKTLDFAPGRDFRAILSAYTTPPEFGPCLGERYPRPGFAVTRQQRQTFGLSYRTNVSEDGYKIHLIYNALAAPDNRVYSTLSAGSSAPERRWTIDSVPRRGENYRPTSHFVIDTTRGNPDMISDVERKLYGMDDADPYLPDPEYILEVLGNFITDPITEPL
jgi:hypothetical protein